MLAFAILFPVAYAIAIQAILFDGMRHFIFVLPPIACAAALVADHALDRLRQMRWRRPAYGALALYGAYHVGVMAMLHPDEYIYYNLAVGGVHGARGLFKLDYWANSYAEAVQGLEDYLRAEYGADFMDHDFTVAVCGPPGSAGYYFPRNFIYTPDRAAADFFIAFTKDDCDKSVPGTVDLSRRAHGHAVVAGHRPARDRRGGGPPHGAAGQLGRGILRSEPPIGDTEGTPWSAANTRGWPRPRIGCGGSAASTPISSRRRRGWAPSAAAAARCRLRHRRFSHAARRAAPDALRCGIELDKGACAIARAKAGGGLSPAASTRLPFADGSLDAIFSADVLCHRGVEEGAALDGFRRCLKPGGVLDPQPAGLSLAPLAARCGGRQCPALWPRRGAGAPRAGGLRPGQCPLLEQHPLSAHGAAA